MVMAESSTSEPAGQSTLARYRSKPLRTDRHGSAVAAGRQVAAIAAAACSRGSGRRQQPKARAISPKVRSNRLRA